MTKKQSRALWCAALLVLAAALVYYNGFSPAKGVAAPPVSYDSDAPQGFHPGEQLPDFTLARTDGDAFTLSQYRGKATVINLWATWCTPCVNELPHFDRLQKQHPDDVMVLAIHSNLITDDVSAYLSAFDYGIAFAIDADGEVIAALGGSLMLPQTIVLNRYGEVIYNKTGSVTYEALEELIAEALRAED